jgi:GNAT superfamily N-acetyltransferase
VRVREASSGDAAAVAGLLTQLGYPSTAEEARGRLAAWDGEGPRRVLVAEHGGAVAGLVAVAAVPYLERGGSWARIVALAVDAGHRRRGIGRQLIAAAEAAAAGWGCVTIEATSSRRRAESHPFYRRLGYGEECERSALYRRSLG